MKKLIMLSVFALGTITASASNDLFRNYYAEKVEQPPITAVTYNYHIKIWRQLNGSFSWTLVHNLYPNCKTPAQAEAIKEDYRRLYFPEIIMAEAIILNSNCGVITNP